MRIRQLFQGPRNRRHHRAIRGHWPRLLLALVIVCGALATLLPAPAGATPVGKTFSNTTGIVVPDIGTALPYPSELLASGLCGKISKVTVTLLDVSHSTPDDLDILLVGPGGGKVLLMSDAGGSMSVQKVDITLDDSSPIPLPNDTQIFGLSYQPTDYEAGDTFALPAPAGPYDKTLSAFNGTNPNGTWKLFALDDNPLFFLGGSIGGWELHITTDCAVLNTSASGGGGVFHTPFGMQTGGNGYYGFNYGTAVSFDPKAGAGQTFVGWNVDGAAKGWAPAPTLTMNADHGVQAVFAPTRTFGDVPAVRLDYNAIVALATRGYIFGYNSTTFGPDDGVQRAQMAALIARAMPAGPGTPPSMLVPPDCAVAGTWDCEVWPNDFKDQGDLVDSLWRDVAALQHHGVAKGYTAGDCAAKGLPAPCFAPTAPVSYVETAVFITRAMKAKGYWLDQPGAPQPYADVPAIFAGDVATFAYYTQQAGGLPALPAGKSWNDGATRAWFAQALWNALDTYWGTDGQLPDGRPAGGYLP